MSKIRVVTLDLTKTLFDFQVPVVHAYSYHAVRNLFRDNIHMADAVLQNKYILETLHNVVEPAFNKAYKNTSELYPAFGALEQLTHDDWWTHALSQVFNDQTCKQLAEIIAPQFGEEQSKVAKKLRKLRPDIFNDILEHYRDGKAYTVFQDTMPFLEKLDSAREDDLLQSVGCLSNATTAYRDHILPALGIQQYLDFECYAQIAGAMKPSPEIFGVAERMALDALGDEMEVLREVGAAGHDVEAMHIGDSISKDVCAALLAGWKAVWLVRDCRDGEVGQYRYQLVRETYQRMAREIEEGDMAGHGGGAASELELDWTPELDDKLQIVSTLNDVQVF